MLVYSCSLERGITGCLTEIDFRSMLRDLCQLPHPSSDKGIMGAGNRFLGDAQKGLDSIGASFQRMFR